MQKRNAVHSPSTDSTLDGLVCSLQHHPVAVVNGDESRRVLEVSAMPSSKIELSAKGSSDPDKDALTCAWSFFDEPSSYDGAIEIEGSNSDSATVKVSASAAGKNCISSVGELRVLARVFRVTGDTRHKQAFLKDFDHILKAQYPNGGWPQYFPLSKDYHRHIAFNDGTMIRIMEFLRDTAKFEDFTLLDEDRRAAAAKTIDREIDCVVRCQVVVNGQPTVWCAQHDEVTVLPANARSYELASLSGAESAGILMYFMTLKSPAPDVVQAVRNRLEWFKESKIEGFRYNRSGREPYLKADPSAEPLWARFYEIKSNRPFFCDRDGIVKYDVEELEAERRGGYAWYGNWSENIIKAYSN